MIGASFIRFSTWAFCLLIPAALFFASSSVHAQNIVCLRPDRAAPGMNVIVEVLTRVTSSERLGLPGLDTASSKCYPVHASDTNRIVIGPVQVSWSGHLMQ